MELGLTFCVVVAQHRVELLSSDRQCLLLSGLRVVQTIWATLIRSDDSRLEAFFFKMSSIDTEHGKTSWAGPGNPANRYSLQDLSWQSNANWHSMKQKLISTNNSSPPWCAVETSLCLVQATQQILTCWVSKENGTEPPSDVDLRHWWASCCFISIHKHFSIPGRAAQLSVLRLCLREGWTVLICEAEDKTRTQRRMVVERLWLAAPLWNRQLWRYEEENQPSSDLVG